MYSCCSNCEICRSDAKFMLLAIQISGYFVNGGFVLTLQLRERISSFSERALKQRTSERASDAHSFHSPLRPHARTRKLPHQHSVLPREVHLRNPVASPLARTHAVSTMSAFALSGKAAKARRCPLRAVVTRSRSDSSSSDDGDEDDEAAWALELEEELAGTHHSMRHARI